MLIPIKKEASLRKIIQGVYSIDYDETTLHATKKHYHVLDTQLNSIHTNNPSEYKKIIQDEKLKIQAMQLQFLNGQVDYPETEQQLKDWLKENKPLKKFFIDKIMPLHLESKKMFIGSTIDQIFRELEN